MACEPRQYSYKTLRDHLQERDAVRIFNEYEGRVSYGIEDLEGLFGALDKDIWEESWPEEDEVDDWSHEERYVEGAATRVREQERREMKYRVQVSPPLTSNIVLNVFESEAYTISPSQHYPARYSREPVADPCFTWT